MRWKIRVKNYRCFADSNPLTIDLSNPVTALVGPNNSGKTAALRFFWEMGRMLSQATGAIMGRDDGSGPRAIINNNMRALSDQYAVFTELNDRPMEVDLWQLTTEFPNEQFGNLMTADVAPIHLRVRFDRTNLTAEVFLIDEGREVVVHPGNFDMHSNTTGYLYVHKSQQRQYFLDHSNNLYGLDQPTFVPAVRPFGNIQIHANHELILGQGVISQWVQQKQSDHAGARKAAASLEAEIARIFGYDQIEITANHANTDFILKIDNGKSFLLSDMGNGISHFVSLLANIPMRGNPLILIDEPEIGIHASLQVELMSLLSKHARGPVIFATHSIGLARSVADEIISFTMKDGVSISSSFERSPSFLETLGEMSFSAWREIGCDGVLFVEGPSEIKVFSEWLKLFGLHRKWAVLSLGGSETIHAAGVDAIKQVLAIHPKVAVVVDSELDGADSSLEKKRAAFVDACKAAEIPCLATERRATENYFTQRAIEEAISPNARSLEAFEKLADHGWGKRDGLKISAKMTMEELETTDIGRFLKSISKLD